MAWNCPKCRQVLTKVESALVCENGHCYDLARQGYCNLLLANKRNSRDPGDSDEMVLARRNFLSLGHYSSVVDCIANCLELNLPTTVPLTILDMGCGEGYYLRCLQEKLVYSNISFSGVDISKQAVRRAAAKEKSGDYAVASCYELPVADNSVNAAISIFSPFSEEEVNRVLSSGGLFIRVSPGPMHLSELKARIYSKVKSHEHPRSLASFDLLKELSITAKIHLNASVEIRNLLAMTPFFWKGHQEAKNQLLALDSFFVTTDFVVQCFSK